MSLPRYVINMSADVIPSAKELAPKLEVKTESFDYHIRKFSDFDTGNYRYLPLGVNASPEASYVFLGHASQSTFGNLSAKEFVSQFKKSLDNTRLGNVNDIYIVGCEMGLPDSNGTVLAQAIADEFAKQGFSKSLRVHSISAPAIQLAKHAEMYVEIVNYGGAAAAMREERLEGKFNAFVFNNSDEAKRYAKLNEEGTKRRLTVQELTEKQQLRDNAHTFLSEADPLTELRKEYNVYRPNESLKERNQRITDEINRENTFAQKRLDAIAILRKQIVHLREKGKDKGDRLEALANLLEKKYSKNCRNHAFVWMDLVKKYEAEFKSYGVISGTTHKLLNHLGNGDIEAANKIIADQNKTPSEKKQDKKAQKEEKKKEKAKEKNRDAKPINQSASSSSSPSGSGRSSPELNPRYKNAESSDDETPFLTNKVKAGSPPPGGNDTFSAAKECIGTLKTVLANELDKNVFWQLFYNVKGTKGHKYEAAKKLDACKDLTSLDSELNNILNGQYKDIDPTKVTYSYATTRMKDMIEAIQNHDAAALRSLTAELKKSPYSKPSKI